MSGFLNPQMTVNIGCVETLRIRRIRIILSIHIVIMHVVIVNTQSEKHFYKYQANFLLKSTDVDHDCIIEYCDTNYGTTHGELIDMFKSKKRFRDENGLDDDVIIDLTYRSQTRHLIQMIYRF